MEKGKLLGRGRQAEIYAWGEGEVVKLFYASFSAGSIEHEYRVTRLVWKAGLPVPAVKELIEIDGRTGIVYERIEGTSLLGQLRSHPWKLTRIARLLAELHAEIHRHALDDPGIPSLKDVLQNRIERAKQLEGPLRERALETLRRLPDGNGLCHGDFHPDNIILTASGPIVIDWPAVKRGDPFADAAMTSLLLRAGSPPEGSVQKALANTVRLIVHQVYMQTYLRLRNASAGEVMKWMLPVAAARLGENIPGESAALLRMISRAPA